MGDFLELSKSRRFFSIFMFLLQVRSKAALNLDFSSPCSLVKGPSEHGPTGGCAVRAETTAAAIACLWLPFLYAQKVFVHGVTSYLDISFAPAPPREQVQVAFERSLHVYLPMPFNEVGAIPYTLAQFPPYEYLRPSTPHAIYMCLRHVWLVSWSPSTTST